jgi:hypothetical protein
MSSKQKVMVQPINVIFRYLQQQNRVSLWLYDNLDTRIEGKISVSCVRLAKGCGGGCRERRKGSHLEALRTAEHTLRFKERFS